ncbi:MAG: peptidylprolyl isomerase [Kiloniellales bacterium]
MTLRFTMKLHARRFALTALLLLAALAAEPARAQDTLRAAAVVNDEVISMLDLAMRTRLALLSAGLEDSPEVRQRLQPQVLRALIDERLQMQEAERLDFRVTEQQIDEALGRIAQQNNTTPQAFLEFLQNNGVLPTIMREQIRAGLTWQQVISARLQPSVDISDEEVDAMVERVRSQSGSPELLVSEIFLAVDNVLQEEEVMATAERLVEQLRGGANFDALARQFSQSSTAPLGGDLGWVREGQLADELAVVLQTMRPGQVSRPVNTLGGIYLLWLRDQRQRGTGDISITLKQVLFPLAPDAPQADQIAMVQRVNRLRAEITSCAAAEQIDTVASDAQVGSLGPIRLADLPAPMRNLVTNLPLGEPSEPQRVREGVALLLVCERDEGDIDRELIRQQIANERLGLLARRYMRDLRRAANVDLRI